MSQVRPRSRRIRERRTRWGPVRAMDMAGYQGSDLLAGKRALITGGDSGIGRAVAGHMIPLIVVLLLALLLFGAWFALKALWWIAVIVLAIWLLGFLLRSTGAGGRRGR